MVKNQLILKIKFIFLYWVTSGQRIPRPPLPQETLMLNAFTHWLASWLADERVQEILAGLPSNQ